MPNRRAELPLDPAAVAIANEKLWAKYPKLERRRLSMSSADTGYREFWVNEYLKALPKQPEPPPPPKLLEETVLPCQQAQNPGCGRTASQYKQQAEDKIAAAGPGLFERNQAITNSYADMYKRNPGTYKWAGMAAFASCEVGHGMHEAIDAQSGWKKAGGVLAGVNGKKLEKALKTGNDAVYADIYWQHLAYDACGIADLQKAHEEGQITDDVLEAWSKIDEGKRTGNEKLIWQGNKMLLKFEQREVLQSAVYDKDPMLWINASGPPASWYQEIESPIPGDDVSFQDYYYLPYSIGDFDARWEWIEKSMLPNWQRLDARGIDNVSQKMAPCLGSSP